MSVEAWIDGCCLDNGKPNARCGIGCFVEGYKQLSFKKPFYGQRQTSQEAEINAAIEFLKLAKKHGFRTVKIYTDSSLVYFAAEDWIKRWKRNNWRNKKGQEIVNKASFMLLNRLMKNMSIEWEKVDRAVHWQNRKADESAKEGARNFDKRQARFPN